ncbi:hypothetical protein F0562_017149 [Nyssa sinensis]|uniref:Uncharacterized protein n=1 Tax=Nyssa sinensis TaxID=561372 RepID=A0A5J4ZEH7_9ASTE|nr:hypothetical protein F0562_017149 [Nyssa sinensis]
MPEIGNEKAAPARGDGAGGIPLSCAETDAAAKNMAATKAKMKMLSCAIGEETHCLNWLPGCGWFKTTVGGQSRVAN